jgi:hypothetical protein
MLPRTLLTITCTLSLWFAAAYVFAQTPNGAAGTVNAVIRSDLGKSRRLEGQSGHIGRAGLRPRQNVRVTLECPGSAKGDPVVVRTLDGGTIIPANDVLKVGPDNTVSFNYQGGNLYGLYRVMVLVGGGEHVLEFYVLDLERPGNNPPRVRVVD